MMRFARPKTDMMRLHMTQQSYNVSIATQNTMLQLCATEILRDFARPKTDMMRLCANQKRYVAAIATQNGYVVTLRDRKIRATLREPKQI